MKEYQYNVYGGFGSVVVDDYGQNSKSVRV